MATNHTALEEVLQKLINQFSAMSNQFESFKETIDKTENKTSRQLAAIQTFVEETNRDRTDEIRNLAKMINVQVETDTDGMSKASGEYISARQEEQIEITDDDTEIVGQPSISRRPSHMAQRPETRPGFIPTQLTGMRAKDAIRTIETLRGRDDVGVEDFIHSVRKAKTRCCEPDLLLDLILVEKITEHAKRSIRYLKIESYETLYDYLRQYVSPPTTLSNCRDKLKNTKQGATESVQSYNMRFRQQLNELQYAVQNENRTPTERRIAMGIEEREALRTYILNLRREIGQIVTASDPQTISKAQQLAADKEQWLRDANNNGREVRRQSRQPGNQPGSSRQSLSTMPLNQRIELKCTKCNKLGHTAERCYQNFPYGQQGKLPPAKRVNKIEEEIQPQSDNHETKLCDSTTSTDDYNILEPNLLECDNREDYFWTQEQE
ncbi:unnamed protein product [Xylocopa violacea]|uniref:CCHC-type domain-containing protein n=1 Tax=Xylocopa violacea TaxID=135666 RepID=A0ABP1NCB2_XYLVO